MMVSGLEKHTIRDFNNLNLEDFLLLELFEIDKDVLNVSIMSKTYAIIVMGVIFMHFNNIV